MSKLTKTIGKLKLWLVVSAVLVVAGILMSAIFGFNADAAVSDSKTLTVKMNSYAYFTRLENVKEICEAELDKAGFKDCYTLDGETSGDSDEIVYVFSAKTDEAKLREAGDSIQAKLTTATDEEGNALNGQELLVTVNSEDVSAFLPDGYFWRNILAAAVILVIEFVYIAVRYKLNMGVTAAATSLLGLLLTLALVAITRIPVMSSLVYVAAFAMLYSAFIAMVVFNRMRENFRTDEYKAMSAEEAIVSSVPAKFILIFAAASIVALVLVGGIAVASVRWFAVASIVAVVAGTYSVLVFMPAMYLPLKKISDKKAAERARYDYKKDGKKDKGAKANNVEAAEKSAPEA